LLKQLHQSRYVALYQNLHKKGVSSGEHEEKEARAKRHEKEKTTKDKDKDKDKDKKIYKNNRADTSNRESPVESLKTRDDKKNRCQKEEKEDCTDSPQIIAKKHKHSSDNHPSPRSACFIYVC
ncbi:hypothetical protein RFI_36981, partial [Reticulomyxa filosa]